MENLLNNNNICSEWVVVTPQLANDLLQTQITNRPISYVKVAEYAELMKEGKWEQCGDTICVDENNHLTDGQHRLLAIVKSGISQKMLLVRGIKHSIYKDTGSKRSLTGNIKIASDAPEEVKIGSAIELARFITSLVNNSRKANITEVDAFLKQYTRELVGFMDEVGFAGKTRGNIYMRKTTLCAFFLAYVSGIDTEILRASKDILKNGYSEIEVEQPLRFRPIHLYNKYATELPNAKKNQMDAVKKCCIALQRVDKNVACELKTLNGKVEYDLEFNHISVRNALDGKEKK